MLFLTHTYGMLRSWSIQTRRLYTLLRSAQTLRRVEP
jgi:hypothetical protein